MLAARLRFHGHGSLKFLYKNAPAYRSRYFTIKTIANPHRKNPRVAVIVSKKVHKSAVGRNRMRRRVYEVIRGELPAVQGVHDIAVIISSSEVMSLPHQELQAGLRELLAQSGIYR